MKILLVRTVNDRERYYTIQLLENLFGESVLTRTYGSIKNVKPTGRVQMIYSSTTEAAEALMQILMVKQKRGYVPRNTLKGIGR
jgi:predicted DNA-binding WGR domain protein